MLKTARINVIHEGLDNQASKCHSKDLTLLHNTSNSDLLNKESEC